MSLNQTIAMIGANPDFMFDFAKDRGSQEIKWGLKRLREDLRRIGYNKLAAHNPLYKGLYKKANSVREVNENDRYISMMVKKRAESPEYRADADDGIAFARQLEVIDPRRFIVKYRPRGMWRDIMPIAMIPWGKNRITYRVEDFRAQVGPVTVGTKIDIPYIGVSSEEYTNKIVEKGLGYQYSVGELEASAFTGIPLPDRYQKAVMYGYEENQDDVAFDGDTEESLEGLINHTGVSNVLAAAPASGTDKKWSGVDKTNNEKVADIRGMVTKIAVQSQEQYNADRTRFVLLLPRVPYDALNQQLNAGTDTTVLEFILANRKYGIDDIKVKPQLAGKGTTGTDLAIMIPVMDPEVIEFHVSDEIRWQPAQFKGLFIKFPSRQRHGGVVIRYPLAMTQLYGI